MNSCIRVIDVGGNGFRRADVYGDEVKSLVASEPIKTVEEAIQFSKTDMPSSTIAISFASAGVIEDHDLIEKSPNVAVLSGVRLGSLVRKETGLPSIVCNDMEAAAIGMSILFPNLPYFMGITWSSGIGARVVKNKEIISESEVGHICLDNSPYAMLCGCGLRGCAEAILSGDAIKRRVVSEVSLRCIDIPATMHPCALFDQELSRRAKWAEEIKELIVEGMATFLANIQSTFCLPAIVWKGNFAQQMDRAVFAKIKLRMMTKIINPTWVERLEFWFSPQDPKDKDSFLGAAAIAKKVLSLC